MSLYKCNKCGMVVSKVIEGVGTLVCCNEEMHEEKITLSNEGKEKHTPILEKKENGNLLVKVGSIKHPMTDDHYIALIQVLIDGKYVTGKRLYPGDDAELEISKEYDLPGLEVLSYCNLHGLWKKD